MRCAAACTTTAPTRTPIRCAAARSSTGRTLRGRGVKSTRSGALALTRCGHVSRTRPDCVGRVAWQEPSSDEVLGEPEEAAASSDEEEALWRSGAPTEAEEEALWCGASTDAEAAATGCGGVSATGCGGVSVDDAAVAPLLGAERLPPCDADDDGGADAARGAKRQRADTLAGGGPPELATPRE
eukprot:6640468-Prymnesium_polylepis.1